MRKAITRGWRGKRVDSSDDTSERSHEGRTTSPSSSRPDSKLQAIAQIENRNGGLHEVFPLLDNDDTTKRRFNVVAIHGLGGHFFKTWRYQNSGRETAEVYWLSQLLPHDLPECRVFSFGYDSTPTFSRSVAGIRETATMLLHALLITHEQDPDTHFIFICHSLGGLVIKQALVIAHEDEYFSPVLKATHSIAFFGTPHRGSDIAPTFNILAKFANMGLDLTGISRSTGLMRTDLIGTLTRDSQRLNELNDSFRRRAEGITIISCYETIKPVGSRSLIVTQSSAVIGFLNEISIPLKADHMAMCRFYSAVDPNYRAFSSVLLRSIRSKDIQDSQEGVSNGQGSSPPNVVSSSFLRPVNTLRFRRDPDFVERDISSEIWQRAQHPAARVALVGLGGIGKSQIAIEHAYRVHEASPETWVFWVHASSRVRFEESFRDIAHWLRIPQCDDPQTSMLQPVHMWLSDPHRSQWMIIVDNADDDRVLSTAPEVPGNESVRARPLSDYLPQSSNGAILITSRSRVVAQQLVDREQDIITIAPMEPDMAANLLQKKLRAVEKHEDLIRLADALDRMPLALTQAAAYINQRTPRMTTVTYLEAIKRSDRDRARIHQQDIKDPRRDTEASNSITATWQISFEYIRDTHASSARLLAFMSMFDREAIPASLLRSQYHERAHEQHEVPEIIIDDDEREFEDDVSVLRAFDLIGDGTSKDSFDMHHLVQFSTREWLETHHALHLWRLRFVQVMYAFFPSGVYGSWPECQMLLPHALKLISYEMFDEADIEMWTNVVQKAGRYLFETGHTTTAERLFRKILAKAQETYGSEDLSTAQVRIWLAATLDEQGRYSEAEAMCRATLRLYEPVPDQEDPVKAEAIDILAQVLENQGKYKEAEIMYRQALRLKETMYGKEHHRNLNTMSSLAVALNKQGNYEAAEVLHRRALQLKEQLLGRENPSTLVSMNNLAMVLDAQGKFKEAEVMHRRNLQLQQKVLGEEHRDTLISMNNLARVLAKQGESKGAEEIHRQVLQIRKKVLGDQHPDTWYSAWGIASALTDQGKFHEEGLQYWDDAVQGLITALGEEHPVTRECQRQRGLWT